MKASTAEYLSRLTHALRLRGSLAEDPTARTLHALLLSLAIWFGFWSTVFLLVNPNLARLAVDGLYQVTLVAALVLLRYGSFRQASLVYLAGLWVSATARIAIGTGIHSTTQVVYVTMPILATWLLGYRAAMWTAGACLGSSLVFACLELAGERRVDPIVGTPLATWNILLQVTLTGVVPLAHVLRTLKATLSQSRRTEEELRKTVDWLHVEIAERARTELALRESEQRFKATADTAPVMIVAADANRNATFFNKAWLDFTGRAMAQEIGTGWARGIHPDDVEGCLNAISSAYEKRGECRVQYRLRRADGEYRLLMCSGVPRFEPDGSFVGYVASCIDITELKRSQEVALARQKLESLGVLAGGIAHDFNNLLCGIMADSELLIEELRDHPSAQESLKRIDAVAIRASEIVRQLMVYAGQEIAEFDQIDLAAVLNEMLQMMRLSISKNATLRVDVRGKLPLVNANITQIRQVVMNLLTNASEALGGKEGFIYVTLERVYKDHQSATAQNKNLLPGNYLRLEVFDSGCGMTEKVLAGIFDPFFTTKGAGRGLGLSAVQGIVRSHGGNISVISTPSQGSCFEILLPCPSQADSPANGTAMEISTKENDRLPGAVLLIEDEDTIRLAVAKMLRKKGFSVLESGDGRAAVDLFRAHAPQIEAVLLDVTLPAMSGREVLQELRKTRPAVKVILTSAYGRDHALETVGGQQSEPYIRKPYQLDKLAETIRRICLSEPSNHAT